MKPTTKKLIRKIHRWSSIITALPFIIVCISGLFLQLKKDVHWIQPRSITATPGDPLIAFNTILDSVKTINPAQIKTWDDIDRLDVRPDKGIVKVRAKSSYEIQLDLQTGRILQTAYRRTDLIENFHDGSFFHLKAKYWIFLPSAILTILLWLTGILIFFQKGKNKKQQR